MSYVICICMLCHPRHDVSMSNPNSVLKMAVARGWPMTHGQCVESQSDLEEPRYMWWMLFPIFVALKILRFFLNLDG